MEGAQLGRLARARRGWNAAEETLADVVGRHPLTTGAMVLSALTWLQPQIWHVVADVSVPPPHLGSWVRAALFAAFLVLTLTGAIAGAILVVPYQAERRALPEATVVARWLVLAARRISGFVHGIPGLEPLVELLVPPGPLAAAGLRRRRWLALAVFLLALAWMTLPALARARWLGSCGERMPLALALTSVAGYLAVARSPTRTARNLGRFLFMLVVGLALGELAWILAPRVGGSYRFYVVWSVPFVQWLVIAVGRIADDWPAPAGRRVRWGVVLALVAGVLLDAGVAIETVGHLPVPRAQAATGAGVAVDRADSDADAAWLDALAARIERNRSGPVIFVAASGGGSRAAMFAALVFELLGQEPIDPTAPVERPGETVAGNVSLVSSVSGGSLATAYFVSGRAAEAAGRQPLNNMDAVDIARRMSRLAADYHARARGCKSYWDPRRCERLLPDRKKLDARLEVLARVERTAAAAAQAFLAGQRPRHGRSDDGDGWVLTSGFVDDMAIDFMAPLLRGVISPFRERGETVADFWQERFGWPDRETAARDASRAPLVFFNATEVATGKRLVIPFPPTSPALFPTDPLVLSTTATAANVRLADAVRLSANFPWGFEIGEVERVPPDGAPAERIRIIDGGVTDNTGIDSLAALVVRIEELAAGLGEPVSAAVRTSARRLRDLLVARGLLVIEIDSGAKPTRGGLLDRIPVISEPLDALAHARYGGETALKAAHLARLKGALLAMREHESLPKQLRALPEKRPALSHVELTCNRADAIMTAWSLGPEDKAKILASFLVEAALARTSLRQTLGQGTNTRAEVENLLVRTPPRRVREHVKSALAAEAVLAREAEASNAAATAARKAMYVELDKRAVGEPQPNLAPPRSPAPDPPPGPASNLAPRGAERAACTPAPSGHRDWVYLGTCEGTTWRTRYFRLPTRDPAALGEGDTLVTVGRTHVRASVPDATGVFAGVRTVIPPETEVTLAGCAQRWSDSDFWWAPIAPPPAPAE